MDESNDNNVVPSSPRQIILDANKMMTDDIKQGAADAVPQEGIAPAASSTVGECSTSASSSSTSSSSTFTPPSSNTSSVKITSCSMSMTGGERSASQIPRLSSSSTTTRPRLSFLASPPPPVVADSRGGSSSSSSSSSGGNSMEKRASAIPGPSRSSVSKIPSATTKTSSSSSNKPSSDTATFSQFPETKEAPKMRNQHHHSHAAASTTTPMTCSSSRTPKIQNNNGLKTMFTSPLFELGEGGAGRAKSQVRVVARIRPLLNAERAYCSRMSIHPHVDQVIEEEETEASPSPVSSSSSPGSNKVISTTSSFSSNHSSRENQSSAFSSSPLLVPASSQNTNNDDGSRTALSLQKENSNSRDPITTRKTGIPAPRACGTSVPSASAAAAEEATGRVVGHSSPKRRSFLQTPSPTRKKKPLHHHKIIVEARRPATSSSPPADSNSRVEAAMPQSLIATTSTLASCSNVGSTTAYLDRRFDFDVVFPTTSTQEQVYQHAVGDAIRRNILRGYHTTIIAYGQTGSGKTYTMGGSQTSALCNNDSSSNEELTGPARDLQDDDGIIPRAIADLFEARNDYKDIGKVTIELTCLEIYKDELRDLLVDNQGMSLELRDHGDQEGVVVRGLQSVHITSVQQALEYMHHATLRRTTAVTAMNERSSRSHAICTLSVSIQPHRSKSGKKASSSERIRAKLTLVDLAGSERIKDTGVVGLQQQESININKDLFVLGKVVSTLSEKSKLDQALATNPLDERLNSRRDRAFHVPYRDCKLTRLLRDSLGGNCCTVLVACVSPAEAHVEESMNTLRYAERSRSITNSIRKNVVLGPSSAPSEEVSKLRAENKKLKVLTSQLKRRLVAIQQQSRLPSPQNRSTTKALGAELSGLQAKLEEAEAEARAAREQSLSVMAKADRWKEQLEQMKQNAPKTPSSHVTLPFDVASNEDSTTEEESCTTASSLKPTEAVPEEVTDACEDDDTDTLDVDDDDVQGEIESLVDQKFELADQLAYLRDLIEAKQVDLEEMEEEFGSRQSELLTVIAQQEQKREELDKQVAQMKLQMHLLTTNLNSNANNNNDNKLSSSGGRSNFSTILRTLSADGLLGMNNEEGSEVEMQTNRAVQDTADTNLQALLQDERAKCLEKERENEQLRQRLMRLEAVKSDHEEKQQEPQSVLAAASAAAADDGQPESSSDGAVVQDETPSAKAGKTMLQWAADNVGTSDDRRNSSISLCSSFDFSEGTELRPPVVDNAEDQVLISNLDEVERVPGCMCTRAPPTFSSNPEHVEFYLPKLRLTCSYCRPKDPSAQPSEDQKGRDELGKDPLALTNILREWQVRFLASMGITHAVTLIQANARKGGVLAKQMRRWRRKERLLSIKTKSCWIALRIWARTCQTIVKSTQERNARGLSGKPPPSFLEVPFDNDNRSVSTLGGDVSVRVEAL